MEKRRVVITGMGTVNPLGHNVADTWQAVKAGVCGVGPITRYDASAQKVVDSQGIDIEKIGWQARRESSDDLKKQGVDTTLIAR